MKLQQEKVAEIWKENNQNKTVIEKKKKGK